MKGHELGVTGLVFLDDNTILSASQDRTVRVWNVAEGKELRKSEPTPDDVMALAWAKDAKVAATIGYAGHVLTWDAAGPKPAFKHRIKGIAYGIGVTPDGKTIVTAHESGSLFVTPVK